MNKFQCDANRLPVRLQAAVTLAVMFSDVRHHMIIGTVPTSAFFGTEAGEDVFNGGRLFHTFPAVTGKAWSMMVLCFDCRTCNNTVDAERNRLHELMSATRCNPSVRYGGAVYHSGSGRRGQRDGTQFAEELEASVDHREVETLLQAKYMSRAAALITD